MIKLNEKWSKALLQYPETGMGYQEVDIHLKDGQILEKVIIHNAEIIETKQNFDVNNIEKICIIKKGE